MEQKSPGLLLVLSGPSGVGKGTVREGVLRDNPDLVLSVSATTRSMREGEVDGRDYFYISQQEFSGLVEKDAFLEYIQGFDGESYGTLRTYVEEHIVKGYDVLLEIDVHGGLKIKEAYPDAVLVFLAPPSMEELKRRLMQRGTETMASIERRTETASKEMQYISSYDYFVVNSSVEHAEKAISAILCAEKSRVNRCNTLINVLLGKGVNKL